MEILRSLLVAANEFLITDVVVLEKLNLSQSTKHYN